MAQELEVRIKEIIERTYNVKSLRVSIEGADFKAGQFLQVTLKPELKRYLSLSNSPTENGYIEFTKKITESDFSKALCALKVGDTVKIKFPLGNFILGEDKKIAFLSGGIGITPIRSICKYVADHNTGPDIILLYSNRTAGDIAFREDFDKMQKDYPKLKVVHLLSDEIAQPLGFRPGRINSQVIKEEIPDYTMRKFYLCGPPGMVEAMKKILAEELAVTQENIITENFQGY